MNFLTGTVFRIMVGVLALALLVVGVVVVATGGDDDAGEPVGPTREEQDRRSPEERARAHLDVVPAGDHQGRLVTIDPATVTFRLVQILRGPAAQEAAREDGRILEGDSLPGDVYVRDTFETVTLPIAEDARIVVLECPNGCQERETTLDALVSGEVTPQGGDQAYFVFTVADDTVVAMAEVVVPTA